jgi:hypothetical protein
MSTDEDDPVISDAENAKKSDGTSTAGEHNADDTKSEENSTTEEETKPEDEMKKENNKRDINEVEKSEEADETVESTITNKKTKIIDSSTDEGSPKVPNEEQTVV